MNILLKVVPALTSQPLMLTLKDEYPENTSLNSLTIDTSQFSIAAPLTGEAAMVFGQLKSALSAAHASTAVFSAARLAGCQVPAAAGAHETPLLV